MDDINPNTPSENLDYALDIAVDKLEVPTELQAKDFIIEDSGKMKEFYKVLCALFKRFNQNSEVLNAPKKTSVGMKLKQKGGTESSSKEEPKEDTTKEEIKEETKKEETKEEDVKEQEQEHMCQECEENKATKYCKDCELKQCEDCVTHMHKLKKRKDHVLISIKEYLSTLNESKEEKPKQEKVVEEKDDSPIGKCLLHPETKIAAYCRTCDEPICTTCLLSNHDGHKKMNLEEAKPISTEEYNNILEDLKDSNSLLTKFKKQLTENNSLALSTLSTYFSNIRKNLDEKEDSLKKFIKF